MEDKDKKISVGGSAKTEMRELISPDPSEKAVKGIIRWGADNLYPQELISWRQDNPIHGGILNQKVTFISSAGVDIVGPTGFSEMLTPIIPEIVDDFETFNGFALIFKRSFLGQDNWKVEFQEFESVRFTDKPYTFAVSDDWSHQKQSAEKTNYKELLDVCRIPYSEDKEFILYARVKPKQRKLQDGNRTSKTRLSMCYYPVPTYAGALVSILAGIEQDFFTYSESVNGYKGGTIISLNNGQPATTTEADKIADDVKLDATNRNKQGGIVVLFSDGKDNAPTVMSMNGNDLDKRYIESNKEIRDKILTGHSVGSPTLFGIKSEAAFGSKEEMEVAYTLFANNYVTKRQTFISEALVWAFKKIGVDITITFKKYVLSLTQEASDDNKVLRQLNSMSPLVATKVLEAMTPDEVRALAKLLPKQPTAQVSSETMSAVTNAMLINKFRSTGVKRKDLKKVHKSREYDYKATDEDFLAEIDKFEGLTPVQIKILKMISEGKSFNEVSKAIGKGALALTLEILKLRSGGYIKGWKVQDKSNPSIEVMYSYEVKPGFGPQIIPTTREFCRDLVTLDRLYTRAEIDQLSAELDMDVWRYRGGWYHNPETGKNTPSCRHEWRQNIVSR